MAKKIEVVIDGKDNTGKAFKSVDSQLGKMTAAAKKAGLAIAAALSVRAVSGFVQDSIDAADAASKGAAATGLLVEEYTALQYAARLGGVSVSELDAGLSKFNRTIDEAASGGTKQAEAFSRLGISITDAGGNLKTNQQLFAEVADAFKAMPDGIQKSAIAMELLGRSGSKFIPTLNGGADGLAAFTAEAVALNKVISGEQAAASEVFNDNIERLGLAGEGAGNQLAGELLPTLVDMSELMVDVTTKTGAMGVVANALGGIIKVLATGAIGLGVAFEVVGTRLATIAAAAVSVLKGDFAGALDIVKSESDILDKSLADAGARIEKLWDGSGEAAAKAATKQKVIMKSLTAGLKYEQDEQVKNAKAALAERVKAEREAAKQLDSAKKDQLDTEKRYKEALAGLNAGASGDPSYGAAEKLKVSARQALGAGDLEGAKSQAQASLKIIQDLAAAGENTYGFAGFIKELQRIEQGADQANLETSQKAFDSAKKNVDDLKAQIEQVKKVEITPTMSDAAATAAKAQVQALADELSKSLVLTPTVASPQDYSQPYTLKDPVKPQGFATGGHVRGPGSGTSDSIMARLSNGEYVMRAAAVKQYGTNLLDNLNGLRMPKFADGGLVSAASSSSGGSSLGTVNISLDGKNYSLQADQQNFADLVQRQKWKRGSTRA